MTAKEKVAGVKVGEEKAADAVCGAILPSSTHWQWQVKQEEKKCVWVPLTEIDTIIEDKLERSDEQSDS